LTRKNNIIAISNVDLRVRPRVRVVGVKLADDMFVFMSARKTDATPPYSPDAISRRYKKMAGRLTPPIDTHIHAFDTFLPLNCLQPELISEPSLVASGMAGEAPLPCASMLLG
jgi:hypothetical protein